MLTLEQHIENTLTGCRNIMTYWDHPIDALGTNAYTGEMKIRNCNFEMIYVNYNSFSAQVYREYVGMKGNGVYYLNEESDNYKLFNFFKFHGTPYEKKYNGKVYYSVKGVGYFLMTFEKCGDKKGIIIYSENLKEIKSWIDTAL